MTEDTEYDLYFSAPHNLKFESEKSILIILAPKFGVGLHGRNFGCYGSPAGHGNECFSNLNFSAHLVRLLDGKLDIQLSNPTNGFIYYIGDYLWLLKANDQLYIPLFCIENENGKAKYLFESIEEKTIKEVEYDNNKKCNDHPYGKKVEYFLKTYSSWF